MAVGEVVVLGSVLRLRVNGADLDGKCKCEK